jgi:hypothetical protein
MAIKQVITLEINIVGDGKTSSLAIDLNPFMRNNTVFGSDCHLLSASISPAGVSITDSELQGNMIVITFDGSLSGEATLTIELGFDLI